MAVLDIADQEKIKQILEKEGQLRKSELEEEVETSAHINHHLMLLVEEGDAALFPVGEVVIIRPE